LPNNGLPRRDGLQKRSVSRDMLHAGAPKHACRSSRHQHRMGQCKKSAKETASNQASTNSSAPKSKSKLEIKLTAFDVHNSCKRNGKQQRTWSSFVSPSSPLLVSPCLVAASIHEVSTNNKHFDADQEVEVVSCCHLVNTTKRLECHSFQCHLLTSFGFRYDRNCKSWRSLHRPTTPQC
jgi:hypothetical protein